MHRLYTAFADQIEKRFHVDARYFLSGGFWLSAGQAATIIFGLATTALFAHFLSETEYGVYRYLIGLAAIFSAFSLTGIGQSILQTAAKKYYGFYRATLRMNFLYSLGITVLSLAGAGYYWLNDNSTLAIGCVLIAFLQPLTKTFQINHPFLQGSRRFKDSTSLHTAQVLFTTIASVAVLFITQNILLLFATYLLSHLIVNLGAYWYLAPPKTKVPNDIFRKYISYAKHTSVRNIFSSVAQRLDTIIVFTQLGAAELAIYSIATVIPEQIKGSFKNIATLITPKYSMSGDPERIKASIPKRSVHLFLLALAVTAVYIFCAPIIYEFLFPKYSEAILFSQIAALSLPGIISVIPISYMKARLQNKELYYSDTITSIIMAVTTFIGVHYYGILGAVLARLVQRYLSTFIVYVLYK